jgi:hypothetical protein
MINNLTEVPIDLPQFTTMEWHQSTAHCPYDQGNDPHANDNQDRAPHHAAEVSGWRGLRLGLRLIAPKWKDGTGCSSAIPPTLAPRNHAAVRVSQRLH